jgi:hypothetical protein
LKQNISDVFDFSTFVVAAGEQGIWDDDEQAYYLTSMVLATRKIINGGR